MKSRQEKAGAAISPDESEAESLLVELLSISGESGREAAVAQFLMDRLRRAGVPQRAIRSDRAHWRSPYAGEVGNLVYKLAGTRRGPRRLFIAHMDTVPLCAGSVPLITRDIIRPASTETALGADDRAGTAVLLATVLEVLRSGVPHPPLTFLWTVQEEVGLCGARYSGLSMLGGPKLAFNFDGGSAEKLTIGATGGYRMKIHVHGVASHAGNAPEKGVSAIAVASTAIAQLHRDGWHGSVQKAGKCGTSNVGVIRGGDATNVVTPYVEIRAEARSHDPAFRRRIVKAIEQAFRQAARSVRNESGRCGSVDIEGQLDYEAYRLPADDPSVAAAEAAVRACGGEPVLGIANGGLDANWMTARGIPTVSLGCGQVSPHTVEERLDLKQFRLACRVAARLATGTEHEGW